MATAMNAPIAQANWNRDSNRANARPWFAPGASRCTMLSKLSRPSEAARLRIPARTIAPIGPPSTATVSPVPADTRRQTLSIDSSLSRVRTMGAIALPAIDASAATPTTAANQAAPWSCERSQNARWKKVKPTVARSTVMAMVPSCRLDAVSWVASS